MLMPVGFEKIGNFFVGKLPDGRISITSHGGSVPVLSGTFMCPVKRRKPPISNGSYRNHLPPLAERNAPG